MDMGTTLRSISVVLVLIAFISLCVWVFLPRRKDAFKDVSNAPFADEPDFIDNSDDKKNNDNKNTDTVNKSEKEDE